MKQQDKMFYLLDGMEMSKSEREWLEQRFANMTEKEIPVHRRAGTGAPDAS